MKLRRMIFITWTYNALTMVALVSLFFLVQENFLKLFFLMVSILYCFILLRVKKQMDLLQLYYFGSETYGEIVKVDCLPGVMWQKFLEIDYAFSDLNGEDCVGSYKIFQKQASQLGELSVGSKLKILFDPQDPTQNLIYMKKISP